MAINHIAIFCQPGTILTKNQTIYGCLRATLELAKYLSRNYTITLYVKKTNINTLEKISVKNEDLFFGSKNEQKKYKTIIGISRGDCFLPWKNSNLHPLFIVYHHGPHVILGLAKQYYKLIDYIVCVSRFSQKQQIEYGIDSDKIKVIPNAIDKDKFKWNCHFKRNKKTFIYAGNLNYYKGIHFLLDVFQKVLKSESDVFLDVYGENQMWEKHHPGYEFLLRERFLNSKNYIDWEKVSIKNPNIKYRGEISYQNIAIVFQKSGFCLNSSWNPETFGLTSLEAQACGCYPILPNFGGLPETLQPFCPRLLYEPRNFFSFEQIILKALKRNRSPFDSFRRKLISYSARRFSWQDRFKEFEKLLS